MRSHGHKPDIFGNIRKGFSRKAKAEAAAAANANKAPAKGTAKKK